MDETAVVTPTVRGKTSARRDDPVDALWHLFCSPKLALLLILAIAVASFFGSLIMQVPDAVRSNPADYYQWLSQMEEKYGTFWTKVFHFTKLFYVFNSFWFKGLILLLITNIIVCSINRWKSIWHGITFRRVIMAPSFYTSGGHTVSLTYRSSLVSPDLALRSLAQVLAGSRYRVWREAREGTSYLYSDRHRLARLGTYATHLSIILLLVGVLAEGLGFRNPAFIVSEGSTKDVGHDTGLSVYLEDFTDEWYLNDTPKDYRSEVVIYDNGVPVRQGTIRVNEPIEYQGVRFHQSFYGTSVVMEVRDRSGALLFNDAVALPWRTKAKTQEEERPLGSFTVPGRDLTVYGVLTSGPLDTLILPGQLLLEIYTSDAWDRPIAADTIELKRPKVVGDLEFTFVRERQFTGLQVVRTPGTPLVWVASFLLITGNVLVLFFPLRQVWARSYLDEREQTVLELRALAARDEDLERELQRVREQVIRRLSAPTGDQAAGHGAAKTREERKPAVAAPSGRRSDRT
ncbi:MAG: cytochrome c biogenesis protein ResB [Chloroflexi bacterium]|nr:cytochrome c biogenesis protein ResB [Chloroflexota bacterium]